MRSEFRVITPSWRVTITLGITAAVVLITAMFVFRDEVRMILVGGASLVGVTALIFIIGWYKSVVYLSKTKELDYRIKQEQLHLMQLEADKLALQARFFTVSRNDRAIYAEADGIRIIDAVPQVGNGGGQLALPAGGEQLTPVMNVIERENCVIFFGPRRSGKTSTALNWMARQPGKGIIFDPKGRRLNLWPEKFEVISDVSKMMQAAERFMAHLERYRVHGRIKPEPYLFFVDEPKYLESQHGVNLLQFVIDVAMFGGEYNFHSGFTIQAKTISHTGLDSASLLNNFVIVRSAKRGNDYHCYVVGLDGKETEYAPPPPYPKPQLLVEDLDFDMDEWEAESQEPEIDEAAATDDYFVGLVEGGMSRRQAALEAYGRDYAGAVVTRGKRALGEIN